MQTPAIESSAALTTALRSTRESATDGKFENVLATLLEPARSADIEPRRRPEPRAAEQNDARPRTDIADDTDDADLAVEVPRSADQAPADSATCVETTSTPDASPTSSRDHADDLNASADGVEDQEPATTPVALAPTATAPAPNIADAAAVIGVPSPSPVPSMPAADAASAGTEGVASDAQPVGASPSSSPAAGSLNADSPDIQAATAAPNTTSASDANPTVAGTANTTAAPAVDPVPAAPDPVAQPVRSDNTPSEPPGRRISALAPERRGTELASVAADKALPDSGPRAATGRDATTLPAAVMANSSANGAGSPRPLVEAGTLIAAVADRPANTTAAGNSPTMAVETGAPATSGAAAITPMIGADSQFDPAGDHAGLHLGYGTAAGAAAASGPHTSSSHPTFGLRSPVEQVAVQVVRAAGQSINHLQITLEPADLGRVDVRLELGPDHRLVLAVSAERPETLDLLQRDSRALERALQEAGLKTDPDSLSFNLRGENRNDRSGDRTLTSAPAHAAEPDSVETETPPAPPARAYRASGPGSLDIRI